MDLNDEENIEWLMESSKTVDNVVENEVDCELREKESMELYNFLQVLRSTFESEPVLIENKAKGTVKTDDDVQKLIKKLKALGYFFSVRSSDKRTDKTNYKLMILSKKNPPSCYSYKVNSHTQYYCSHKSRQKSLDKKVEGVKETKRYNNDCKAMLDVKQIEIFTSVPLPTVKRKRIQVLKKFRITLAKNPQLTGDLRYTVVVSLPRTHNHSRDVTGQYLSDEVKAAMHCVLNTGVKSLPEIQEKLYQIVDKEFENDSIKPSRDNSAFYPNLKIIYNHLRHDGLAPRVNKNNTVQVVKLKCELNNELNQVLAAVSQCDNYDVLLQTFKLVEKMKKLVSVKPVNQSENINSSV